MFAKRPSALAIQLVRAPRIPTATNVDPAIMPAIRGSSPSRKTTAATAAEET